MTAKKVKQLEEKLQAIQQWIDYHEEPAGIPNILENMNFLLEAVRKDKEQFQMMREQQGAERNTMNLLGQFLEKKELMDEWEEFFKTQQDEAAKSAEAMNQKELDKLEEMKKAAGEQGIKGTSEEKEASD
jgi:hypothetical protein